MLEYDVLAFIVGGIMESDFWLLELLSIGLKLVIESWIGLMAYGSTFGLIVIHFFGGFGGGVSSRAARGGDKDGSGGGSGPMPSSIYTADGTNYRLRQNLGYGAEYASADDPSDTIPITNVYSRTDSEMDTNADIFISTELK